MASVPYEKMSKKARAAQDRKHRVVTKMNTGTRDMGLPYKAKRDAERQHEEERYARQTGSTTDAQLPEDRLQGPL